MSIKTKLINAVDKIFRKFKDFVETGRLRRLDPAYSTDTGVVGTTGVPDDDDTCDEFSFLPIKEVKTEAFNRLMTNAGDTEADSQIRTGDLQIILKYKDLDLEPSTEDRVELRNSIWDLVHSNPLFGVAYILTLRRQNA